MASEEKAEVEEQTVDSEGSINEDLPTPLIPSDTAHNLTSWWRQITVEPTLLLLSLAVMLTEPVETTLFLTHTCRSLGYNETTCAQLEGRGSEEIETAVQGAANVYVMSRSLIETIVPAGLTVFAGPWSDRRGRRTFLFLSVLGFAGKYATLAALSCWPALAPGWLLLAAIPASLGGGFVLAISMCFCYVSDVSTSQRRAFRMSVVEASFYGGILGGVLASTHLFAAGGYVASYACASALCLLATLYTACVLTESTAIAAQTGCGLQGLLDVKLVTAMWAACVERRPGNRRLVLWLAMTALSLAVLVLNGENGVGFQFVRRKFAWDIQTFTTYGAITILMQILFTLVAMSVLSVCLGLDDALLCLLSLVPKVAAAIVVALSPAAWWLYVASALGAAGSLAGPLCRAVISKSVPPDDVGKAFSLVTALEAVTPLAAAPLYTLIYNATLADFPGAYYLLSAAIYSVIASLIGVVVCVQDKTLPSYDTLVAVS